MFFSLGHAQDFLDSGASGFDLVPAIDAQGAHAAFNRFLGDGGGGGAAENQWTECFVQNQYLVDALAALVTQLPAFLTAHAVPKLGRFNILLQEPNFAQVITLDYAIGFAYMVNITHLPFGYYGLFT